MMACALIRTLDVQCIKQMKKESGQDGLGSSPFRNVMHCINGTVQRTWTTSVEESISDLVYMNMKREINVPACGVSLKTFNRTFK